MADIVTITSKASLNQAEAQHAVTANDMDLESFLFYCLVQDDLSKLEKSPRAQVIDNILNYSKKQR